MCDGNNFLQRFIILKLFNTIHIFGGCIIFVSAVNNSLIMSNFQQLIVSLGILIPNLTLPILFQHILEFLFLVSDILTDIYMMLKHTKYAHSVKLVSTYISFHLSHFISSHGINFFMNGYLSLAGTVRTTCYIGGLLTILTAWYRNELVQGISKIQGRTCM